MKRAILSDIHGNLEALEQVFRDIDRRNEEGEAIEEVLCLGDIVGYGANPRECLDLVRRRCSIVLGGNHELGAVEKIKNPHLPLNRITGYGGLGAREGILWTIHQIFGDSSRITAEDEPTRDLLGHLHGPDHPQDLVRDLLGRLDLDSGIELPLKSRLLKTDSLAKNILQSLLHNPRVRSLVEEFARSTAAARQGEEWLRYLTSLPSSARVDGALLVHDNPFHPGDARYILDPAKANPPNYAIPQVFAEYDWKDTSWLFFGHSHFPGIYADRRRPRVRLANPGSVGIPRSDTLEASYLIWNPRSRTRRDALRLIRLPLESWRASGKKMEQAGLPNKLKLVAERQAKGLD